MLKKPITISGGSGQTGLLERIQAGDYIDPATLGSGTADANTFLRGDNTWAVPAGSGGGNVDGGNATSVYTPDLFMDGGGA